MFRRFRSKIGETGTIVTLFVSVALEQKRFEIYACFSAVCKLWLFGFIPHAKIFGNVNIKWSKFVCEKNDNLCYNRPRMRGQL